MEFLRKVMLPVVIMLIFIAACDKDDDKTTKDYLIGKTCWSFTKVESQNQDSTWTDVTSQLFDACYLDNCINFKSDGTFIIDEGASKCKPTDPQTNNQGTWSLSPDEKELITIDQSQVTSTFHIESISATSFVGTTEVLGVKVRYTFK